MAPLSTRLIICYLFVVAISCYPLDKQAANQTEEEKDFQPVPLPTEFGSYDLDGNGYIDLKELAEVSETSHEEAKRPFVDADADDDDQISPSEFEKAPWSLQGKVEDLRGDDDDSNEDGILDDEDGMMMEVGEPVIDEESDDEKLKATLENDEENPREEEVVDYEEENIKNLEADDDDVLKEEPLEDESDDDRNISEEDMLQDEEEEEDDDVIDDDNDDDSEERESDITDPRLDDDVLRDTGYASEEETVENAID